MSSRLTVVVGLFGATTCAVTAGVYVNFSARVMPSLGRMPNAVGIARMQGFNKTALQAPFMVCFFGAALASGYLVVRFARGDRSVSDLLLAAGGTAYLAGFLLTIGYNVPLNERLAAADPHAASSVGLWRDYLQQWTTANSVRAVLSTAAVGLIVAGLVVGGRGRSAASVPAAVSGADGVSVGVSR